MEFWVAFNIKPHSKRQPISINENNSKKDLQTQNKTGKKSCTAAGKDH
jgi:hypothetical protein